MGRRSARHRLGNMIATDNQNAWREATYDSMEPWTTTSANQLFLFYLQHQNNRNISKIADSGQEQYNKSQHGSLLSRRSKSDGFVYVDGVISTVEDGLFYMTEATTTFYSSSFNSSDSSYDNETTNSTNFTSPHLMPWPQRSAWIAVFTLLVVVAAVGNALVVWVVYGQLSQSIPLYDLDSSLRLAAPVFSNCC